MNVIWAQMAFFNMRLPLPGQIAENLTQIPAKLLDTEPFYDTSGPRQRDTCTPIPCDVDSDCRSLRAFLPCALSGSRLGGSYIFLDLSNYGIG